MSSDNRDKRLSDLKNLLKMFIEYPTYAGYIEILRWSNQTLWPCEDIKQLRERSCVYCPVRHDIAKKLGLSNRGLHNWCLLFGFAPLKEEAVFDQYKGEILRLMIMLSITLED